MFLLLFFFIELSRSSEEPSPVAPPVAPLASEPQVPVQSQPNRTEESERSAERQPPLELPPEPCKVPLHVPMSNSMLESLPMNHISTTLAGGIWVLNFNVFLNFFRFHLQGKPPNICFYLHAVLCRNICSIAQRPATAEAHGGSCGNEQPIALPFKYNGTYWQADHCATRHR